MPVCYRHPARETGVSCSSCGRPICPDCMTSTSVGMRCPECARQKTKVKTMRSTTDEPVLTYALLAVNVIIGLALMLGAGSNGANDLYSYGALDRVGVADGEWWRLISSGFIHGDQTGGGSVVTHLLFNMLALYVLGTMLEPAVGRLRFAVVYFVSLLCGSLGALIVTPDALTAGASGAVFGLMGAAMVFMRQRGINPMESGLALWLGLNLLITFTISGISIGGHIGGLIGGGLSALIMFEIGDRVRLPSYVAPLISAAVGLFAAAAAIAVSQSPGV